jgi:hypothetical protein
LSPSTGWPPPLPLYAQPEIVCGQQCTRVHDALLREAAATGDAERSCMESGCPPSAICQHVCLVMPCLAGRRLEPLVRMSWDDVVWSMVSEGSVRGPHSLHTAEATGSKPVTPTSTNSLLDLALSGACQKICQKTTLSRQRSALSTVQIEGSRRVRADHLLAKPDRPAWSPATARNGAVEVAVALSVIVRWGTGPDRCEWHASGTTGEDDVRGPGCVSTSSPQSAARPGDACLVGKSRRPAAAVSWDFEPAAAGVQQAWSAP